MAKYRIVGGVPDPSGILELPDDANIIGVLYHPMTGELNVVMLQEIPGPKTAGPAAAEKTEESIIHLPPTTEKETTEKKSQEESKVGD